MIFLRVLAVVLILGGAWALAVGEFSYTKDSKDVNIGPIELAMSQKETVALPQWAGFGAIGIGVLLLVVGGRKR